MPKVFTQKEIRAQIYDMFDHTERPLNSIARKRLTRLIKSHSRVDQYKLNYIKQRILDAIQAGRTKDKLDPHYEVFQSQLIILEKILDWIYEMKPTYLEGEEEDG